MNSIFGYAFACDHMLSSCFLYEIESLGERNSAKRRAKKGEAVSIRHHEYKSIACLYDAHASPVPPGKQARPCKLTCFRLETTKQIIDALVMRDIEGFHKRKNFVCLTTEKNKAKIVRKASNASKEILFLPRPRQTVDRWASALIWAVDYELEETRM